MVHRCLNNLTPLYVSNLFNGSLFVQTRKAIRYSMTTYPICDSPLWRSARRSFAPSVTEIALNSPLCVNRSPVRYGFRAGAKATRYSVNIALASAKCLLEMTLSLTYHIEDWLQVSAPLLSEAQRYLTSSPKT